MKRSIANFVEQLLMKTSILMEKIYKDRVIQVLNRLGIQNLNAGATTGQKWLDTKGDMTASVSPIDGEIIANVTNATAEDYETVIRTAEKAFYSGKQFLHPFGERWSGRSDWPCGSPKKTWVFWSPWRWERSTRKAWVKCRK